MMLKEQTNRDLLKKYLDEYIDTYSEYIPDNFKMLYSTCYDTGLYGGSVDSHICQYYKEYDLIKKEYDMYLAFMDIIKHNHKDLSNSTILDIGGGIVPALGRELAKEAKHVIVVDRNIADKNNPTNLEVIKEEVTDESKLPKADIVVGLLPCEATKYIINHACNTDSDFLISLCGCVHDSYLSLMVSQRAMSFDYAASKSIYNYKKYAYDKTMDSNLGDLIEYDSPYMFPYPVIGNKRK